MICKYCIQYNDSQKPSPLCECKNFTMKINTNEDIEKFLAKIPEFPNVNSHIIFR